MQFIRGDTFAFKFLIKRKDGTVINLNDIASLYITIKTSIYSNEIILKKTLDDVEVDENGYVHVVFKPSDTENLDYNKYIGDIEITLTNEYRKTKVFEMELMGETTFHKNGGDAT